MADLIKYPMYSEAIENRRAELLRDVEALGLFGLLACADSYGMTRQAVLAIILDAIPASPDLPDSSRS